MKQVKEFSYTTNVKFDVDVLAKEVLKFQDSCLVSKVAKNNAMSLLRRLSLKAQGDLFSPEAQSVIVESMTGSSKGNSTRVYYSPSYTQYPKIIRKAIIPMNPENKFVYFDVKSAEFIMNCILAGDYRTVEAYKSGEDVYVLYRDLFPEGTSRSQMKEALISNMYGVYPSTLANRLGVSLKEASQILMSINSHMEAQSRMKKMVTTFCRQNNFYVCPEEFDPFVMVKVSDVDQEFGFNENRALSIFTQSALGLWMHRVLRKLLDRVPEGSTVLSVFDSALFEVPKTMPNEEIIDLVKEIADPFNVEIGVGPNFLDAQYNNLIYG